MRLDAFPRRALRVRPRFAVDAVGADELKLSAFDFRAEHFDHAEMLEIVKAPVLRREHEADFSGVAVNGVFHFPVKAAAEFLASP